MTTDDDLSITGFIRARFAEDAAAAEQGCGGDNEYRSCREASELRGRYVATIKALFERHADTHRCDYGDLVMPDAGSECTFAKTIAVLWREHPDFYFGWGMA